MCIRRCVCVFKLADAFIHYALRYIDKHIEFDFDGEEEEDPVKYYTDPKELDAQVFGFKRMSKLTGKPFEEVVKNWFKTHMDFHHMNDDQVEYVIGKIMEYKSSL